MIYHDTTAIDAVNQGRDIPDAFYHKSTLIGVRKYVATDGWRGYNTIVPEPGYKLLEDTWVTGDWDDAPSGHSSSEVERHVKELEEKHGNIWVIFTPTSNVFSTGVDVLIRDAEVQPVKGKTIAHKTKRFEHDNGDWSVRYHATHVIRYNAAKDVYTLDTGGWNTMTTSKRMTEALPSGWYTYRKNWVMYLHRPGAEDVEIVDGMEVQA